MKTFLCTLIFFTVFSPAHYLFAQATSRGLWDNVKDSPAKLTKGVGKTASKIKKFKDHLQRWGLDTSYNRGIAIGARLNSNGWTGLIYYQKRLSRTQSSLIQLSLTEVKHEKQVKQQRENTAFPELGPSSPFVFGKINNLYELQLGYGREYLVLPGVLEGNMGISFRVQAGVSLAMLKPYYLKLIYVDYTPDATAHVSEEAYDQTNSEKFLNSSYILGASKWKEGLNKITYVPGGYFDAAVVIEPLKNKSFIKIVTLGINGSVHTHKLGLMANQAAYPYTICIYAGLSIGKRWK